MNTGLEGESHKNLAIKQAIRSIEDYGLDAIYATLTSNKIEDAVASLYDQNYAFQTQEDVYKRIRYQQFTRTKRRWVRAAIQNLKEKKSLKKDLNAKANMLSSYIQVVGVQQFKKEFHSSSVEEYIEKYVMDLQKWSEDPNMLIHTYPFWSQRTPSQKLKTLNVDILMILGEVLRQIDEILPAAHHTPTVAVTIPFFGVSERMKNNTKTIETSLSSTDLSGDLLNYEAVIPKYKNGVADEFSILVSKEFIQSLNGKVPDLDAKDFEAFIEILSYRDTSFQSSRKIIFPLSSLVQKLYSNDSGKSYELTTRRLMKLGHYRVAGRNDQGDLFVKGLFSSVTIKNASGHLGDRNVIVSVTEEIYDSLLKQQIVSIYGKQIESLKGSFAFHLAFVLQKERLTALETGEENPIRRHWRQFTHSIRFNKSRKADNLHDLEASLDRIKDLNFILLDWHRSGDYYFLSFSPIEKWELEG